MTFIELLHAHPIITILAIWAGAASVQRSFYYLSNAIVVRAQLNRGIPMAEVRQLKSRKWVKLHKDDDDDEDERDRVKVRMVRGNDD